MSKHHPKALKAVQIWSPLLWTKERKSFRQQLLKEILDVENKPKKGPVNDKHSS